MRITDVFAAGSESIWEGLNNNNNNNNSDAVVGKGKVKMSKTRTHKNCIWLFIWATLDSPNPDLNALQPHVCSVPLNVVRAERVVENIQLLRLNCDYFRSHPQTHLIPV